MAPLFLLNKWYLSVGVPVQWERRVVRIIINCECLAESMLHDFEPINVHGAFYLKTFKRS